MSQKFDPGAFLIFQLESGYGLLRVLGHRETGDDKVWHVTVYREMFLDPEMAEHAISHSSLTPEIPHAALTNRAFESTQVAFMAHQPLTTSELVGLDEWLSEPDGRVYDRSIRLLLGVR